MKIIVSGGLNPERIAYFKEAGAPVDSYAVGSYISGATPIDFTGDIKEIDGRPIAKRGRIPGLTDSPRLQAGRPRPPGARASREAGRPTTSRAFHATIDACTRRDPREPRPDDERESAYELFQRGHELLDGRHHAQAAIVLERAARLEPGKASILEALGRAYYNSGRHERARVTFEALLEIDPSAHYAHFALGQSLKRLGPARRGRHASATRGGTEPRDGALPRRPRARRVGSVGRAEGSPARLAEASVDVAVRDDG